VTTTATIAGSRRATGRDGFTPDGVRVVEEFDAPTRSTAPAETTTGGVAVTDVTREPRDRVSYAFEPRRSDARTEFTVRTRTVVGPEREPTVSLTENVRFRWRDAGLLRDRTRVQHTPGSPRWTTGT